MINDWGISCEIALRLSLDLSDDESPLIQVMACCRYLSQCGFRCFSSHGVTRPHRVKPFLSEILAALVDSVVDLVIRKPLNHKVNINIFLIVSIHETQSNTSGYWLYLGYKFTGCRLGVLWIYYNSKLKTHTAGHGRGIFCVSGIT